MNLSRFLRTLGAAAVVAVAAFAQLKVGDPSPDKVFSQVLNSDGRKSMAELKGSPILIDWWGNH